MRFVSQARAALLIDPIRPPSASTVRNWHTRVQGPIDDRGRRIYTHAVINAIKAARSESRSELLAMGRRLIAGSEFDAEMDSDYTEPLQPEEFPHGLAARAARGGTQ